MENIYLLRMHKVKSQISDYKQEFLFLILTTDHRLSRHLTTQSSRNANSKHPIDIIFSSIS